MLVYGDAIRHESPAAKLGRLRTMLATLPLLPEGLPRHARLVAALIEAGELAQGIADHHFHAAGDIDRPSPGADAAMALVMAIAQRCETSWCSYMLDPPEPAPERELAACAALLPRHPIAIRQADGFACGALYPESYLETARAMPAGDWQVLGIRSIGVPLAAMVACGLRAPLPRTVRPVGHPFEQQVCAAVPPAVAVEAGWAVVDGGPEHAGPSMASAGQFLLDAGVAPGRLHFLPGHLRGPGPDAAAGVRTVWSLAQLHGRSFVETVLHAAEPEHRLATWVAAAVGPLTAPLRDISAGGWRALQGRADDMLPPVHASRERRKFIAESESGRWLVKFIGLGRPGELKYERARTLAAAGFTPRPVAFCHGFMVERWQDDMAPLPARLPSGMRARLLERMGDYLAFRGRSLPAEVDSGASIRALHAMGRHNSGEALGSLAAAPWDAWSPLLDELALRVHRVKTDNRMHAWEWLVAGQRILKTDAIDHHAGPELVGCQDIGWDIVGASVEFTLDPAEEAGLVERVSQRGGRVDRALLHFLRPCYLAFQLGYYRMAFDAAGDAHEAERLRAAADHYQVQLETALHAPQFRPGWWP